jgi:hypothetical protein
LNASKALQGKAPAAASERNGFPINVSLIANRYKYPCAIAARRGFVLHNIFFKTLQPVSNAGEYQHILAKANGKDLTSISGGDFFTVC